MAQPSALSSLDRVIRTTRAEGNAAQPLSDTAVIRLDAMDERRAAEDGTPEMRQAIATVLLGSRVPALVAVGNRIRL
jgi:hypothetical protein